MAASLPELLSALGEVFLIPGACPEALAGLGDAPWDPDLRDALDRMLGAQDDLPVAYAGVFLVGRTRPPIPLELSVLRSGHYLDEEVMEDLHACYARAGLHPEPGFHPDHLGLLLTLLGHLIGRCGVEPAEEAAARDLLARHLGPLASQVEAGLARAGTPPFYAAAGTALGGACALASELLG